MTQLYTWFVSRMVALKEERGAAAVEYGLLVALIAVIILGAVAALGTGVKGTFCTAVKGLGFSSSVCP